MISTALILSAMLALPQAELDRSDSPEARRELYAPIAEAIAAVAKTPREASLLVSVAWHESRFTRAALSGNCDKLPVGQQCDMHNGRPLARGAFQLHEAACRTAYAYPAGSPESLRLEAGCAARLLRFGGEYCAKHALTPAHGSVANFAGQGCSWSADKRVKTAARVLAVMRGERA